jgi:AP-3 complex subunit delta
MPEGARPPPPPSLNPPPAAPMATRSTDAAPQVLSSFPAYVVDEEIPRAKTPEPIKVKRVKKKGASSAKSKRTVAE